MAKKIEKYVPKTKVPAPRFAYKVLDKSGNYNDFFKVYDIFQKTLDTTTSYYRNYYDNYVTEFKAGNLDANNWRSVVGTWRHHHLLNTIFPYTEEFTALNDAFMAEYDSRPDLQEAYAMAYSEAWIVSDRFERRIDKTEAAKLGFDKRPESMLMWSTMTNRCWSLQTKTELSRETPYQEGDLVLLRTPYVNTKFDPMHVDRWSEDYRNGKRTPDVSVLRIGTVIGITDRTGNRVQGRGSKIIQLQWIGQEDISDVAEKFIKWHERPTYKNGMKKREE
jgi:hypothetical protein